MSAHRGILLASFLVIVLVTPSTFGQQAPQPVKFSVDVKESRIYVKVTSATALGHSHGVEGKLQEGRIAFAEGGKLVFDMASFTADARTARERVGLTPEFAKEQAKQVNDAMLGERTLHVKRFPTAVYEIKSLKPLDGQKVGQPGKYAVEGAFTLRGKERIVRFDALLGKQPDALRLTGTFSLRQTDYGIEPYSALGGLLRVADELTVMGDLMLRRD